MISDSELRKRIDSTDPPRSNPGVRYGKGTEIEDCLCEEECACNPCDCEECPECKTCLCCCDCVDCEECCDSEDCETCSLCEHCACDSGGEEE